MPEFIFRTEHITKKYNTGEVKFYALAGVGRGLFKGELTKMTDLGPTKNRRDHVGFVFQSYDLVPSLTAYEYIQLVTNIAADPMPANEALGLLRRGQFRNGCI